MSSDDLITIIIFAVVVFGGFFVELIKKYLKGKISFEETEEKPIIDFERQIEQKTQYIPEQHEIKIEQKEGPSKKIDAINQIKPKKEETITSSIFSQLHKQYKDDLLYAIVVNEIFKKPKKIMQVVLLLLIMF